jgi:hypothetical protein
MICPGRIEGAGRRGKPEIADYVLTFRNHKLAVIKLRPKTKARLKESDRPRPTPKNYKLDLLSPPTVEKSTAST